MDQSGIPRKLLHIGFKTGVVLLAYVIYSFFGIGAVLSIGFALLLVMVLVDMIRIEYNADLLQYKGMLKATEKRRFHAGIYSVAAGLIVFGVLDFWIAFAALLMASLGDPIAYIIGKSIGRRRKWFSRTKTLEGTTACLVVCCVLGVGVLMKFGVIGIIVGLFMAITATLAEFFSHYTEDNFTIPLFAAFVGQVLWWIF